MKKETVSILLNKLEREAKRVSDKQERDARINAIRQCEECLALPWTQILDALGKKWKKNTDEGLPLLKKPQGQRSEKENACLKRVFAADDIYRQFYTKILPQTQRALQEQRKRQRRKNERQASYNA
jgi:hypothetical protein